MAENKRKSGSLPTVADVAASAGVSTATAARALGGYGYVGADARAAVEAAAARLGYRRNRLARGMVTGRTQTLGFVAAGIEDPFFSRALRGASDVARAEGFEVLIANSDDDVTLEKSAVRLLDEQRTDGLIIAPVPAAEAGHLAAISTRGTPVVLLDRMIPGLGVDGVLLDNVGAARMGVEHLIASGHERIALVTTGLGHTSSAIDELDRAVIYPYSASTTLARSRGYLDALRDAGLPVDPQLIINSRYSREGARYATEALLKLPSPPTAVFTIDDVMTLGVYEALKQSPLVFPEDVSMVGFDDLEWTTLVQPALTVVAQPARSLGAAAARLLLERLGGDTSPAHVLLLNAELVKRESVVSPRGNGVSRSRRTVVAGATSASLTDPADRCLPEDM